MNDIAIRSDHDTATVLSSVRRPVLRWHGGKWRTSPWIIGRFPAHKCYVEPFGGAASVLLRKVRSNTEIYNDLDTDVVNLFRVLRSDQARELTRLLELTPFSRDEFVAAYGPTEDPVERARRLVIRSLMGRGSNSHSQRTGFRSHSRQSITSPAVDWVNYPDSLVEVVTRLKGVTIENDDALNIIRKFDARDTLFYVDPPYLPEVRDGGADYAHEMTHKDHLALIEVLVRSNGMVVLSGYPSPVYDRLLKGWKTIDQMVTIEQGKERIERVWINPACQTALARRSQPDLFTFW